MNKDWFKIDNGVMTVEEGVTTLRGDFMEYCDKDSLEYAPFCYVESIVLPSSLEKLECTFNSGIWERLNTVDFSKCVKLKTIPKNCFASQANQVNFKLPESIETIEEDAFNRTSLNSINHKSKSLTLGDQCFEITTIDSFSARATKGPIRVGNSAFYQSIVTRVSLKAVNTTDFSELSPYCFWSCQMLKEVFLDCILETIPEGAFMECFSLHKVRLPEGLREISSRAFYYCSDLTLIVLPDSIEKIADNAFSMCSTNMIVRFLGREWKLLDFENILRKCNADSKPLREAFLESLEFSQPYISKFTVKNDCLIITNGVTSFDVDVNAEPKINNETITKLTVPRTLRDLTSKFSNFTKLSSVEYQGESNLEVIGKYCFNGCKSLKTMFFPKTLKCVSYYAFEESGLEEVVLEFDSMRLGTSCFSGCNNLKRVLIKGGVFIPEAYCFDNCGSLREVLMDCKVTKLPQGFFEDCSQLKSVVLPNSLKFIMGHCFVNCSALKHLKVPDSVVKFENGNAFSGEAPDLVIEFSGLAWGVQEFRSLVEASSDGPIMIDDERLMEVINSDYANVLDSDNEELLLAFERCLKSNAKTLGDCARLMYPEEFAVLDSKRWETSDTIEETSLF